MFTKSRSSPQSINGQISGSVNSALATVEGALSSVRQEFQGFFDDAESLLKETSSLTGEEFDQAKMRLNERIATARKTVENTEKTIFRQTRKSIEAGNTHIHERLWQAIGAGTALGLFIGLMLSRSYRIRNRQA